MDRTVEQLLEDARELAREQLERKHYGRSTLCGCLWDKGKRVFLCNDCRERFPRYAAMFDAASR